MTPPSLNKLLSRLRQAVVEAYTHRSFTLPPELVTADTIPKAIDKIQERSNGAPLVGKYDSHAPIFILSAGWRSGSTLLQRLLCSSGEAVIWGEPLGDFATIPRLAHTLEPAAHGWPPDDYFSSYYDLNEFGSKWIANVTPPFHYLRVAHQALLYQWLGGPAAEQYQCEKWGMKEVRLTIEHAYYLRWIFPKSKFLFIVRNPVHAYASWRGIYGPAAGLNIIPGLPSHSHATGIC